MPPLVKSNLHAFGGIYPERHHGNFAEESCLSHRRLRECNYSFCDDFIRTGARAFSSAPPRVRSRDATSAWLAAGGDGRVTLHGEENSATAAFNDDDDIGSGRTTATTESTVVSIGINAYGTSTHPRPEVIERSSCTSSSPRMEAFAHVDEIRAGIADNSGSSNEKGAGGLDLSHLRVQPSLSDDGNVNESGIGHWPVEATPDVSNLVESNRIRLLQFLGLKPISGNITDDENSNECAAIMCASGTDAELISALAGIAAAGIGSETVQKWTASNKGEGLAVSKDGASLVSILMPGTGSGVGDAAGMRHHSAAAPQADSVQPGEPIGGMVDGLIVAFEPVRENIDVTDEVAMQEYMDAKKGQTHASSVLLHAIAGSKTGMHQPPLMVADSLAAASEDLLVCIDACQMRVTPEYIRAQLSKGYVVLLTGSKFYGGPPFAGACLLPPRRAREVEALASLDGGIPSGLAEYFTSDDVPADSMPNLKSKFPEIPNTGLALRWTAALHSMERFQLAPSFMTKRVAKRWVSRVRALTEGFYPAVEVLEAHGINEEEEYRIGGVNTIVSLMIRTGGNEGGLLGVKGLKQLQLLLGTDLSDLCDGKTFPESASEVAKIRAQLGQPVLLGGGARHGVLRLAIGATDICEAVESAMERAETIRESMNKSDDNGDEDPFVTLDALSDAIDAMVVEDVQVLRKIELLATHWEAVAERFDDLPATAVRWQARLAAEGVATAHSDTDTPRDITHVDIGWLKPHEKVVNQDRVTALVDAIARWGAYRKPLLVDRESGSILDGHHRYFAAQKLGLSKVPAALVDYLEDDSISVELWPGDHGVTSISKQDVIDMCLSADVFPPKTSRHTFANPLNPIFVPLEELRDDGGAK
eukprot:CAMPEP_0197191360 /NCGR_PEP_ID=MMETSP1423-20130617/23252_1 /TAXON_ID=476441 /ORGANISM="Pseudo-nitzschia heimii, Strain UNC1101" /LENGTH=872 /DNA_ID=CAMNT_0042643971 /DNA_START=95 /DNA_END=2713 /DNA_ORIENTATION=-